MRCGGQACCGGGAAWRQSGMKLRPKMLHSSSYARITQESTKLRRIYAAITQRLRSFYAEITQFLRSHYAEFTQPLRRFYADLRSHYAIITQPLRNHYAAVTQCLRNAYAMFTQCLRNSITQHYAIALRNCFTQLIYAIALRNCFTQLFYAVLRMSVNEKFTQKSCNLRKGQLADAARAGQTVIPGPRPGPFRAGPEPGGLCLCLQS